MISLEMDKICFRKKQTEIVSYFTCLNMSACQGFGIFEALKIEQRKRERVSMKIEKGRRERGRMIIILMFGRVLRHLSKFDSQMLPYKYILIIIFKIEIIKSLTYAIGLY